MTAKKALRLLSKVGDSRRPRDPSRHLTRVREPSRALARPRDLSRSSGSLRKGTLRKLVKRFVSSRLRCGDLDDEDDAQVLRRLAFVL